MLPQLPVSLDFFFQDILEDEDGMLQMCKYCKTDLNWKSVPEKKYLALQFKTVID